jgi:hypothetical protein
MNKKQSVLVLLLLGTVLSVGMLGLTSNTNHVFAGKNGYDKNDDHISWKQFKNSNTYKDADKDTQNCFGKAHDRGNNLAGYEIKNCEDDAKSYSHSGNHNKYSNNNNDNKKGDNNNNDNKKGDNNNNDNKKGDNNNNDNKKGDNNNNKSDNSKGNNGN